MSLSPYINRFLSADTIVPGYANPQNLNRYSYVTNNPLRYTDPTGHRACGPEEDISCETGLSNNPPDHTNIGCGGPGQHSCLGNSPNKDKDKDSDHETGNESSYTDYSSSEDYYLAGYDYTINWSQVDWYHLITNGAGIVSDAAIGATLIGLIPAAPLAEFTFVVDTVGVVTDVFDFAESNDISGLSLDVAGYVFKETKAARLIPGVGFTSNVDGFMDALRLQKNPIWKRKP